MKYLDVFAYHSYGSDENVNEKVEFGKWAKNNIKTPRFDMSEWCELPCKHDTKSIESALMMARIIGEDLIYTGLTVGVLGYVQTSGITQCVTVNVTVTVFLLQRMIGRIIILQ